MTVMEALARRRPLPPAEEALLARVRAAVRDVIGPAAAGGDGRGRLPEESIRAVAELRLAAVCAPAVLGGGGASFRAYVAAVAALAEGCASTAMTFATTCHCILPIADFTDMDVARRIVAPLLDGGTGAISVTEPQAGSDATAMATVFRPEGDLVTVDGAKSLVNNGTEADVVLLFGKWSGLGDGREAITALAVEGQPTGMRAVPAAEKLGHRAMSTSSLVFEGCRVPRANLVGRPGQGLEILIAAFNKARPSAAAQALGIARAAFSCASDALSSRRRAEEGPDAMQGDLFALADLAAELALCELWLDETAAMVDAGGSFAIEGSVAKLRCSDLAMRAADVAVTMCGLDGGPLSARAMRLFREAKATQIWEGANQLHRQFIGRSFRTR